jgi:hypothetical protein
MPTSFPAPVSQYSKAKSGTLLGARRRSQALVGNHLWCFAKLGSCATGITAARFVVMSCIANFHFLHLHYTNAERVRPDNPGLTME